MGGSVMMAESASVKLREVADHRAVTEESKQSLRDLADALEGDEHVEGWAAVDLRAAFDPETALKLPAVAVWLGRCLDVLVFAPIASTWLGLTAATIAYRSTLDDPALAGQSFLQRWQAGFNGHVWAGLSFDRVSEITFIMVALIVAVAVAHFGFRARAEQGSQARSHRLLSEALTLAERELAPVRLGAVGRVAAEVGKVAAQVAATADEIRKVGEAAERAQDAAGISIGKIAAAMAAVQAATADVAQAVMDMGEKLADATAAISSVADTEAEFGEKLLDATEKLDTTFAGLADGLAAAIGTGETKLVESVTQSSAHLVESVTQSSASIADSLTESARQVRAAIGELNAAIGSGDARLVESVTQSSASVAGGLSEGARQVRAAIGELNAALATNTHQVGKAVVSLGREVKDSNVPLQSMLQGLNAEVQRLNANIEGLLDGEARARTPGLQVPVGVPLSRDGFDGPVGPESMDPADHDHRRWWQR